MYVFSAIVTINAMLSLERNRLACRFPRRKSKLQLSPDVSNNKSILQDISADCRMHVVERDRHLLSPTGEVTSSYKVLIPAARRHAPHMQCMRSV